jgi:hypothetical protein
MSITTSAEDKTITFNATGGDGDTDRLVNGEYQVVLDSDGDLTAPKDIVVGGVNGGRLVVNADDGENTSVRWYNMPENETHSIIRTYTGNLDDETELNRGRIQLTWQDSDRSGLRIVSYDRSNEENTVERNWTFQGDGGLRFPDATVQTTAYTGQTSGDATVVRQDTAPTAANGTLWFNTVEGRLYIKYSDVWVDAAPLVQPPPDTDIDVNSITFPDASVLTSAYSDRLVSGVNELVLNTDGVVIFPNGETFDSGTLKAAPGDADIALTDNTNLNEIGVGTAGVFVRTDANTHTWQFDTDGNLLLPSGGTITEGVVTDNPTIQLTPATPDVASQKLVIKGGGGEFYNLENGIDLGTNNNVWAVSDSPNFYVYAPTRPNETLYWWIVPEGSGISTTMSGIVELGSEGGGVFNFTIISDAYEFRVRVSPTEDTYDPESIGVESVLMNPDAPTSGDYHLHLTTGDLTETSIFLGTDDHNVRTTTDGKIQITTPSQVNKVWEFDAAGDLTLPEGGDIKDSTGASVLGSSTGGGITITNSAATFTFGEDFTGTIIGGYGNGTGYIRVEDVNFGDPISTRMYEFLSTLTAGTELTVYTVVGGTTYNAVISFTEFGGGNPASTSRNDIYYTQVSGDELPFSYSATELTLTGLSNNGITFADGTVQTTAYTGGSFSGNYNDLTNKPTEVVETIVLDGYTRSYTDGNTYVGLSSLTTEELAIIDGLVNGDTVVFTGEQSPTQTYTRTVSSITVNQSGFQRQVLFTGGALTNTSTGFIEGALQSISINSTIEIPRTFNQLSITTVAKDGPASADIGVKGRAATVTASPSNNTNLTPGTYLGVAFSNFSVNVTVAENGDITAVVVTSDPDVAVGDSGVFVGGGFAGGTAPADNIVFSVDTLTDLLAPTAIDLTKTVNKLADGVYSLADGVEGQILYLVPQTGATFGEIGVIIANARILNDSGATPAAIFNDADYLPFNPSSGTPVSNVITLIFTDGAWQASGGTYV